MPTIGNYGTLTVATGSFTTTTTGSTDLPKSTKGHNAYLVHVTVAANSVAVPPFAVSTRLNIADVGSTGVVQFSDLTGTVRGDATYDQATDSLTWFGRLLLGQTRNTLTFFINNDSGSTIVAIYTWLVEVE